MLVWREVGTINSYKVKITVEKRTATNEHDYCPDSCELKATKGWVVIASAGGEAAADSLQTALPAINEIITKQWPKVEQFAGLADIEYTG